MHANPTIKLCGFKQQNHIDLAASLGVEFLGFVFWKNSKRFITISEFASLNLKSLSLSVVAVFENPSLEEVVQVLNANRVNFVQLHNSTIEFGKEIAKICPVIWGLSGENFTKEHFANANFARYFLFDGTQSGSGIERNFNFAKNISSLTEKPFFLAGGINIANYKNALNYSNMLDVSSGIEEISGIKSQEKIKEFVNAVKNGNCKNGN